MDLRFTSKYKIALRLIRKSLCLAAVIFCILPISIHAASNPCETIYLKSGTQFKATINARYKQKVHVRDCITGKKYELAWTLIDSISNYKPQVLDEEPFIFSPSVKSDKDDKLYASLGLITNPEANYNLYGDKLTGEIVWNESSKIFEKDSLIMDGKQSKVFDFIFNEDAGTFFKSKDIYIQDCHTYTLKSGHIISAKLKSKFEKSMLIIDCHSGQKYTIPHHDLLAFYDNRGTEIVLFNELSTEDRSISLTKGLHPLKFVRNLIVIFGCLSLSLFWFIISLI